jgi:hypothetical protein
MAVGNRIGVTAHSTQIYSSENEISRCCISSMSDSELLRFGLNAKFWHSEAASPDDPETTDLAAQLIEARAEWNRRHPGLPLRDSF